jgi:hypothetical protein
MARFFVRPRKSSLLIALIPLPYTDVKGASFLISSPSATINGLSQRR